MTKDKILIANAEKIYNEATTLATSVYNAAITQACKEYNEAIIIARIKRDKTIKAQNDS